MYGNIILFFNKHNKVKGEDLTQIMKLIYWKDGNGIHVYVLICACVMCGEGNESSYSTVGSQKIIPRNKKWQNKQVRIKENYQDHHMKDESNGEMRGRWAGNCCFQ